MTPAQRDRRKAPPLSELLRHLTVLQDAEDEWLVGDAASGSFVVVPEVGAVVIRALQGGSTPEEASVVGGRFSGGDDVDVDDLVESLRSLGLLRDAPAGAQPAREPRVGRPSVSPELAGFFFTRAAWTFYAAAAVFSVMVFISVPTLWPTFEDPWFSPDPFLSMVVGLALSLALVALHESWHWLAARALGLVSTFRVSQRGLIPVAETDVSELWSVPRRRRYGVLLAGMAIDSVVLATALALRWGYQQGLGIPDGLDRVLGAVVFFKVAGLVLQSLFFLRNDAYACLATALGCRNLYRTSWLTLKMRLVGLTHRDAEEYAGSSDRDRAVASWFSLLYLVGMLGLLSWMLYAVVPFTATVLSWSGVNLLHWSAATSASWQSLVVVGLVLVDLVLPIGLVIRERRLRQAGRLL